jgi:hypothetical protein
MVKRWKTETYLESKICCRKRRERLLKKRRAFRFLQIGEVEKLSKD